MRGLTLENVAQLTRLSPRVLRQIEIGDFAGLPAGIHGRGHLRAYARAVGIDAEEIIARLGERLPAEPDAIEALRARVRRQFAADHPVAAAFREGAESLRRRAEGAGRRALSVRGRRVHLGRRAGAALIDAGIVTSGCALMLVLAAWLTESRVDELWRAARWPIAASCGLTMVLYFAVSRSLGGRTTGTAIAVWLAHVLEHRQAQAAARGHAN
jgi:transcriptional regulator with XRE-family HTH domain